MTLYTGDIARQKRADVSTVSTGGPTWFGSIHTRDAPLADGPGSNASVVGRVMDVGFKVTAETENTWYTYMIFLFKNGSRFNGSTLQIGGLNTPTDAEWAILGGTGNLTMARGIVRRNLTRNDGTTQYKVYAYYTPMPFVGVS
nr:unnamed protein product [Digitaria exilis]